MGDSAVDRESIKTLFAEQKDLFQSFFGKIDYEQIHELADHVRASLPCTPPRITAC